MVPYQVSNLISSVSPVPGPTVLPARPALCLAGFAPAIPELLRFPKIFQVLPQAEVQVLRFCSKRKSQMGWFMDGSTMLDRLDWMVYGLYVIICVIIVYNMLDNNNN